MMLEQVEESLGGWLVVEDLPPMPPPRVIARKRTTLIILGQLSYDVHRVCFPARGHKIAPLD